MNWFVMVSLPMILAAILCMYMQRGQEETQRKAQEKVMELIKGGHDAELCPKCKGRGGGGWSGFGMCSECGGLGYLYTLDKEKLREKE